MSSRRVFEGPASASAPAENVVSTLSLVAEQDARVGGELKWLPLDALEPDALNPRLPAKVQRRLLPPEELYPYLDRAYDVISIARSIQRHGYFQAEPLIAIPSNVAYPGSRKRPGATGKYVVVEGNRRLTALKALAHDDIQRSLETSGWKRLDGPVELPEKLPVLVVADRNRAAPVLGFRHITRAAPWGPLAQAKYIADLIDVDDRSFADVADLLSRKDAEVKSLYRNFWIREQAGDALGLEDPDRITDNFGTFTRAMQNPSVRAYVNAPAPRDVYPEYLPLPDDAGECLGELVTWMFGEPRREGDDDAAPPRPGQVLLDSRHITAFGRVLAADDGPGMLRAGVTLEEADTLVREADDEPVDAFVRALRIARPSVFRFAGDGGSSDQNVTALAALIETLIERYADDAGRTA